MRTINTTSTINTTRRHSINRATNNLSKHSIHFRPRTISFSLVNSKSSARIQVTTQHRVHFSHNFSILNTFLSNINHFSEHTSTYSNRFSHRFIRLVKISTRCRPPSVKVSYAFRLLTITYIFSSYVFADQCQHPADTKSSSTAAITSCPSHKIITIANE